MDAIRFYFCMLMEMFVLQMISQPSTLNRSLEPVWCQERCLHTTALEVRKILSVPAKDFSPSLPRETSSSSWRKTDVAWTAMCSDSWLDLILPNPLIMTVASLSPTSFLMTPSSYLSLQLGTQVKLMWSRKI